MYKRKIFESTNDEIKNIMINDSYKRSADAKHIAGIINSSENVTIFIDGIWGSGKTTLINLIEKHSTDINYIYFDIWKLDNLESAYAAMYFSLKNYLNKSLKNKIKSKIKKISLNLLDELKNKLFLSDRDVKNNIINQVIDLFEVEELLIKLLKSFKNDNDKIVLVFDEIDRSNPTFAIKLLNIIKHLREVDEFIMFILADSNKIDSLLENQYGKGYTYNTYFDKFIDKKIDIKSLNEDALVSAFKIRNSSFVSLSIQSYFNDSITPREINKNKNIINFIVWHNNDGNMRSSFDTTINSAVMIPFITMMYINNHSDYRAWIKMDITEFKKFIKDNYPKFNILLEQYSERVESSHLKSIDGMYDYLFRQINSINIPEDEGLNWTLNFKDNLSLYVQEDMYPTRYYNFIEIKSKLGESN